MHHLDGKDRPARVPDGDGDLDLAVSTWDTRGQLRFFRNNGDGTFSDVATSAGWG